MSGVFVIIWVFFKVKSGVFLRNRVAALLVAHRCVPGRRLRSTDVGHKRTR